MAAAQAAVERLRAARDEVTELSLDALTVPELVDLLIELEVDRRRQPSAEHRLIHALRSRTEPSEVGARSWADALATALRISITEARRRIKDAQSLGPRRAMTAEPLAPKLPN